MRCVELRNSILQNPVQPVPVGEDGPPERPDRSHEEIDFVPAAHKGVRVVKEPDKEHANGAGVGEGKHQGGGEYFEAALAQLHGCLVILIMIMYYRMLKPSQYHIYHIIISAPANHCIQSIINS